MELENQNEQLKAETHTDNSTVIETMAAEIAELKARIAELEDERRWRKFSEEKPKEKQWIQVYHPNHSQFTAGVEVRRWDEGCKYDVEVQELYDRWMQLPKEPEAI